jgi:AAA domain
MKRRTNESKLHSSALQLDPSDQVSLDRFKAFAVNHPQLEDADTKLTRVLREPAGFFLVPIYGPSGVGKTTMKQRLVQRLTGGAQPLPPAPTPSPTAVGTIAGAFASPPFLVLEARVPDGGTFNRADYYRTALTALGEPWYGQWYWRDINEGESFETRSRSRGKSREALFHEAPELRHALEEALIRHGIRVVLVDEAQHFLKISGGARLRDQLDWLKSMSNTTGALHVLIGTYELLDFYPLSAQLARRAHDIHFPRYQFEHEEDRRAFQGALLALLKQVPLQTDLVALMKEWTYFYERSMGCIGLLKDWLVQTIAHTLYEGERTLHLSSLKVCAPTNTKLEQMAAEATAAERKLHYTESSHDNLRYLLGMRTLPPGEAGIFDPGSGTRAPVQDSSNWRHPTPSTQVGQRAPHRDPVGVSSPFEKSTKCSFSGTLAAGLSPAQLQRSAISKLQCPECGATWAARLRGESVFFPSHPPRATKMTQDISRWIKQEAGWTLYTRGQ